MTRSLRSQSTKKTAPAARGAAQTRPSKPSVATRRRAAASAPPRRRRPAKKTSSPTIAAPSSSTPTHSPPVAAKLKRSFRDADWDGNDADTDSVASGILEEDVCVVCGGETLTAMNDVLLCDRCGNDVHLRCVGLCTVPTERFLCPHCVEEVEHLPPVEADAILDFPMPGRPSSATEEAIYSPAKPLPVAFDECIATGVMLVSRVFPFELLRSFLTPRRPRHLAKLTDDHRRLTHGVVQEVTKSGRTAELWHGAVTEMNRRLASQPANLVASHVNYNANGVRQVNSADVDFVNREGRYDLRLPPFVVRQLQLEMHLAPLLERLRSVMSQRPTPQLRTHNIMFVPVASACQQWHTDDSVPRSATQRHRYFTILIHLNSLDKGCGGTEIWQDSRQKMDLVSTHCLRCHQCDFMMIVTQIRGRPGDAFVFPGSMLHRGQANLGHTHRFFYYAAFACDVDINVDEPKHGR